MIYLAFYIILFSPFSHEVIICDQISACIPILKLRKMRIVFYCHFPDMLLTQRKTALKKLYRAPIDKLEQYTTGMADRILVNSRFTLNIFRQTFTSLKSKYVDILYPSINTDNFDSMKPDRTLFNFYDPSKTYVLSLNRYERKKNINLVIETAHYFREHYYEYSWSDNVVFIVAGGYDSRVQENVEHYQELTSLAEKLNLTDDEIIFLKSPSDIEKVTLLDIASVLLYTPSGEHFGIGTFLSLSLLGKNMNCPVAIVELNSIGSASVQVQFDGLL